MSSVAGKLTITLIIACPVEGIRMSYISKLVFQLLDSINYVINTMDMTQWGILSVIMTTVGFMALRGRA